MRRFLLPIIKFIMFKIYHIDIIWYICAYKTRVYGKGYSCASDKAEGSRQRDWYFSSISAVYTVLSAEQVGASKGYLLHAGLSGNGSIITKHAIIKQSTLISKVIRGLAERL